MQIINGSVVWGRLSWYYNSVQKCRNTHPPPPIVQTQTSLVMSLDFKQSEPFPLPPSVWSLMQFGTSNHLITRVVSINT